MSNFSITPPNGGTVMLELSWDDAIVLTRIAGFANSGELEKLSPTLFKFVVDMAQHIGNNTEKSAKGLRAINKFGQIYFVNENDPRWLEKMVPRWD